MMYRFFTEPTLNYFNNSYVNAEFMPFYKSEKRWRKRATISDDSFIGLVESISLDPQFKIAGLSFNLTCSQFTNPLVADAVIKFQHRVFPFMLSIELKITPSYNRKLLFAQAENYNQHGIKIIIDHAEQFKNQKDVLPYVEMTNGIKLSVTGQNIDNLTKWAQFSRQQRRRLTVYNVDNQEDMIKIQKADIRYIAGKMISSPIIF